MEISAMRHHTTVFRELLKHVPWHRFEELVEEHGTDARVRRLSTKGQFVALLYGQLSGVVSLREIVTGLSSHAAPALPSNSLSDSTTSSTRIRFPVCTRVAETLVRWRQ
jgi:hypothetical protein